MKPSILLTLLALLTIAAPGCSRGNKTALQADINKQLFARQPAMSTCYKAALQRDKTSRGTMTLGFNIPAESVLVGVVRMVNSEIKDRQLQQCVLSKAQGLKLSTPFFRPVEVTYPVSFAPM
jgi:hypothetical protein